ncbi:hypothetical protein [Streptomyces fradiae]|uniref:hypothetical protein n=1 Tax=Streptomyces fradiae TaxID=1906 RepID=UPI002943A281|nr:hypothetical protein [Streptomyces fradiae]WOI61168.1 hypothetical protein RYQ63_15400 [Streptomyces fradiae]
MRAHASVRTAPPAVLSLLVLPLTALALVAVHLLVLAAPAQSRAAAGPYAGPEGQRVHAPSAAQQAGAGLRECEQHGASVSGALRDRNRPRTGVHALLLPVSSRPACAGESAADHLRAGPCPLPNRERPRTARSLADLQVFRC